MNEAIAAACHALGRLALSGAAPALLDELRREATLAQAGASLPGELGSALGAMHEALAAEPPGAIALEYTRLMVTNAADGARRPLPVPLYEDCYAGERRVMGPRSRAALLAYAAAGLGFDGMRDGPADHLGLELCFVAALVAEEARGERDASARAAFVREHVSPFAAAVATAMQQSARTRFWRATSRALAALPAAVQTV
ncbi:MAG: molecular chaperone TorD family protein [Myxococcales bacterium]|nr:molecular chaperone TorD family protein [Myxococcales bacterium]